MNNLRRVTQVIVVAFILAVLASAAVLLFPNWVLPHLTVMGDRIGIATYCLGVIGLAAIVFAGWEFFASQAKPNLDLAMQPLRNMHPEGQLTRTSTLRLHSTRGVEAYYFDLYLVNNGDIAAERVRVSLRLEGTHPEIVKLRRNPARDAIEGVWTAADVFRGYTEEAVFQGGANLVVYTRPGTKPEDGWRERIATFSLDVPVDGDGKLTVAGYEIRYSVRADRFEKDNGVLRFI